MKKLLLTLVQFVLFFVTFAAGSFLKPLHLRQVLSVTSDGTRVFIWDGVLLMLALFVLLLVIEAARRRLRTAAPWTTLALLLAAAAGFALKLGFLTS
jgi:hypothetical protein